MPVYDITFKLVFRVAFKLIAQILLNPCTLESIDPYKRKQTVTRLTEVGPMENVFFLLNPLLKNFSINKIMARIGF